MVSSMRLCLLQIPIICCTQDGVLQYVGHLYVRPREQIICDSTAGRLVWIFGSHCQACPTQYLERYRE